MPEQAVSIPAPSAGGAGTVVVHGHWGRPVLVFPSEQGSAWDFGNNGMVGAVGGLVEAGRVKLYCVDSHDGATWSNRELSLEERARRHAGYDAWILDQVVPFVHADCGGPHELVTLGCSLGALDYVPHLHGGHLDWLRSRLSVLLVCGRGRWEDTTGALAGTLAMGSALLAKGIRCELDVWGTEWPHDWPSWRAQLAKHLPRFC